MFEDIRESPVETQLYWLSSRYYSPKLCRFISPDDIEYLDPESVNGLNLYCYCLNNPISYADPSGNFPVIAFIIGGIAEGAVVSVIVVLGLNSCTSKNNPSKEDNFFQNASAAIIPNMDLKDAVKFCESNIKAATGDLSAKPYSLQPHGAGGYEIPNGDYSSYSGGRAVFASTHEEDLLDVILGQKIWDF